MSTVIKRPTIIEIYSRNRQDEAEKFQWILLVFWMNIQCWQCLWTFCSNKSESSTEFRVACMSLLMRHPQQIFTSLINELSYRSHPSFNKRRPSSSSNSNIFSPQTKWRFPGSFSSSLNGDNSVMFGQRNIDCRSFYNSTSDGWFCVINLIFRRFIC